MTFTAYHLNYNLDGINLTALKASEGDIDGVNMLLQNGGQLEDAVYGYAFGGYSGVVDLYVSVVVDPKLRFAAAAAAAAAGYARAGNSQEIEKMIKEIEKMKGMAADEKTKQAIINDIKKLKLFVVLGYAQAGNTTQIHAALKADKKTDVKFMGEASVRAAGEANGGAGAEADVEIDESAEKRIDKGSKYLPMIIRGLASANQAELLFKHLTPLYYGDALREAAKAGHTELVDKLLDQLGINLRALGSSPDPSTNGARFYLSYAVEGYSEGRHFAEALSLVKLGLDLTHCIDPLAPNGTLDPMDASLLLFSITDDQALQERLKALMRSRFNLNVDSLPSPQGIAPPILYLELPHIFFTP